MPNLKSSPLLLQIMLSWGFHFVNIYGSAEILSLFSNRSKLLNEEDLTNMVAAVAASPWSYNCYSDAWQPVHNYYGYTMPWSCNHHLQLTLPAFNKQSQCGSQQVVAIGNYVTV